MCDSETTGCFFRSSKKVSQASKTEYKCLFSTWATEYKVCLLFYYFQTANINQKITLCLLILEQTHKKKLKLCGVHLQFHFPIPKPAICRSGRIMLWLMGHCISTWMRRWGSGTLWIHMYFTQIQAQNDIYIYIYRYMHYVWRIVA